ncbi:transposable element Tc3 transposase [Trichonephila clavipes]|uniref:Transposable element Tc3 transposase n=1 Tax=Trichonephila clavipes TaxID=2585209 RepID=A0A8X6V7P4_TRICX|nr:transposable element Tc3 transposase [Trichonephila clavipes]
MLGRRIAARQPPPTYQPELRRAFLDEWCNIPQDQIDNLILSMPMRSVARQPIDGYSSIKKKEPPARFQGKKCVIPDGIRLASE